MPLSQYHCWCLYNTSKTLPKQYISLYYDASESLSDDKSLKH